MIGLGGQTGLARDEEDIRSDESISLAMGKLLESRPTTPWPTPAASGILIRTHAETHGEMNVETTVPKVDPVRWPSSTHTLLFLCTANSCRSILAEVAFNADPPRGWRAVSAGSHPSGIVHPAVLALLGEEGLPTAGLYSKSWEDPSLPKPSLVITLCDAAAAETCPLWLGEAPRVHWSTPDPTRGGRDVGGELRRVWRLLRRRIHALHGVRLDDLLLGERERLVTILEGIASDDR